MKLLSPIPLLWITFTLDSCSFQILMETPTHSPEETMAIWRDMEVQIKSMTDDVTRTLLPTMIRMTSEVELNDQCQEDLLRMMNGVRNFNEWAVKMLDATGKPNGGQLLASASFMGSYDECLSVRAPSQSQSEEDTLKGMYCVLDVRPPLPPKPKILLAGRTMPFFKNYTSSLEVLDKMKKHLAIFYYYGIRIGICLPSSCIQQEVQNLFQSLTDQFGIFTRVKSCETQKPLHVDTVQWIIIGILSVFAFFVILATLAEGLGFISVDTKDGLWLPLLKSFSALSNTRSLLKVKKNVKTEERKVKDEKEVSSLEQTIPDLSCLNGLRFLSMSWVVLGHTNLAADMQSQREFMTVQERVKEVLFQAIANGTLSVDTFFFITSVLVSFHIVKRVKSLKTLQFLILFLKRVWRLLPSVLLTIGLTLLLPLLNSGPNWTDFAGEWADNCRTNWWPVVLFVNNFVSPRVSCLIHTWYISEDLQLFIVALIFILVYFRNPAMANKILMLVVVVSAATTTLVFWFMELTPTLLPTVFDFPFAAKQTMYGYYQVYNHLGVYCIGLAVGSILAKGTRFKMTKCFRWSGWVLATVGSSVVLFGTVLWNGGYQEPVGLVPSIYGGLHRTVWAAGLAWISINCAQGHGGLLGRFLSWPGYQPLNRLTYLVYLMHLLVIVYYQGSLRGQVESTKIAMVWLFFGNMAVSFMVAYFLNQLFEAPILNMEVVITQHLMNSSDRSEHHEQKELGEPSEVNVVNGNHQTMTRM